MNKNYFELLYRVALFFICPLLFASLSCNDNPTNHDEIKPGRRDYTWTVDRKTCFLEGVAQTTYSLKIYLLVEEFELKV